LLPGLLSAALLSKIGSVAGSTSEQTGAASEWDQRYPSGKDLRLQNANQPEGSIGFPVSRNCAPPGSITFASEPFTKDDDFPKGFHLRRVEGTLCLNAYCASPNHVPAPRDRLIFCHNSAEDKVAPR
jgi:hypothetical protein